MKQSMMKLLLCLVAVVVSTAVMAESKPFNLSLTPDIAVYERSYTIEGLTLSIWGENEQSALALGFANGSNGRSLGFSAGWLLNYTYNYKGIQWAPVNYAGDNAIGWQSGLVDYTWGAMKGLQAGVVNYAGRLTGLEFGLVNYVEDGDAGVQIGLINIIRNNKSWFGELPDGLAPVMILFNWRF